MKTKFNFKTIFTLMAVIAIGMFTLTSCEKDDNNENTDNNMNNTPKSITATASADPQFSILVQALVKADLASTLDQAGTFTVFAPTNTAFNELFKKLNVKGVEDYIAVVDHKMATRIFKLKYLKADEVTGVTNITQTTTQTISEEGAKTTSTTTATKQQ